jgi:anti-sigma factor (TIGR02949 family)
MECREAQEHLAELSRGGLPVGMADAVRAHLDGCDGCREALRIEQQLHALVRAQAPRYAAPPALHARVRLALQEAERAPADGWRAWIRLHPWATGALVGALAALALTWVGIARFARDPASRLMARAVEEHVEYAREAMDRPAPDAQALVRRAESQTPFPLGPVFPGDADAPLISVTASELGGRPAVALVYRNAPGRYTTLLLMPGADATIPAEDRLAIETYTPHHRVVSGKQVLYWKQRDLAYVLVSDLDQSGLASMFLKVRKAA